MRIWTISDTHTLHGYLDPPENIDMVIHAGDASDNRQSLANASEMDDFMDWFTKLNIEHKIYVPGNHDVSIDRGLEVIPDEGVHVLVNEMVEVGGLKVYGSPLTPAFGTGWAFNVARHKLDREWQSIPEGIDILVTHGPPQTVLDINTDGIHCGCRALLNRVKKVKPKYHIFGHIHEEGGRMMRMYDCDTIFINASCTGPGSALMNGFIINL